MDRQTVLELMTYFNEVGVAEPDARVSASNRRESVRRQIPPLKRLCRLAAGCRRNREIVAQADFANGCYREGARHGMGQPGKPEKAFLKLVIRAASDAGRCAGEQEACTAAQLFSQLACDLLGILALDKCPRRLHALLEYEGVDFILQASLAHRSNTALQEAVCCALRRIFHDDEVLNAERPQYVPPLRQTLS